MVLLLFFLLLKKELNNIVKFLVEAKANVNEQTNNGYTVLISSAQIGLAEIVKYYTCCSERKGGNCEIFDKSPRKC